MIEKNLVPNIDVFNRIQPTKLSAGIGESVRLGRVEQPETGDFKAVFSGLIENMNKEVEAPDLLLKDAMMGNNNVDVHDVMTAMAKAELNVSIATQVTSKIIQTYEKITSIQI